MKFHISQAEIMDIPMRRVSRRRQQAGQSIIIAIAVMFLMAFSAALFITLVSRNFDNVARAGETLTADYYADAGVRYADQMLLSSPQGADWRPPLTHTLDDTASVTAGNLGGLNGAPLSTLLTPDELNGYLCGGLANTLQQRNALDPDGFWLDQGFSRYNTNGGRFLIRITYGYNPPTNSGDNSPFGISSGQPNGKYLKIESIGRTGEIDDKNPEDPTVFFAQPIRLHAEEVAYVPIGLVDYSRFITNKDNRADTFNLGVPSTLNGNTTVVGSGAANNTVVSQNVYDFDDYSTTNGVHLTQYPVTTVYGDPNALGSASTASAEMLGAGGSLRCNGNLRLYGPNVAFLDGSIGDDWEIAGNLTFDGYTGFADYSATGAPAGPVNPTHLTVIGTDTTDNAVNQIAITPGADPANATPSNVASASTLWNQQDTDITGVTNTTPGFNTIHGLVRDGSSDDDINGYARSIKRLNPPLIDTVNPSTNLTRYQTLCETGTNNTTTPLDNGPYQAETSTAPATVFIDNQNDTQPETTNIDSVAYTLRDDWLNRTSANWIGPFYNPPGATIVFGPQRYIAGTTAEYGWGFTITRSDIPVGSSSGTTWHWTDPVSGSSTSFGQATSTLTFVYGAKPAGYTDDPSKPIFFLNADNPPVASLMPGANVSVLNNDIVIYAQGNVRVRGIISPTTKQYGLNNNTDPVAHHVTIVTDQIAYIDGSIMKGGTGYNAQATTSGQIYVPPYQSDSSIALLAKRYVCVNTTQFLAGSTIKNDLNTSTVDPTTNSIDFGADNTLTEEYDFPPVDFSEAPSGLDPNLLGATTQSTTMLYTSQYAGSSGAGGQAFGDFEFTTDGFGTALGSENTGLSFGSTSPFAAGVGDSGIANRGAFNDPNSILPGSLTTSGPFTAGNFGIAPTLTTRVDTTFAKDSQSAEDWEIERAAMLPSDVRIEAVLYAQDNSFFVIPGQWFNSDASDTISAYAASAMASNVGSRPHPFYTSALGSLPTGQTDPEFPFYGQPIDMKITIDGSVIENVTADISDSQAWNTKWGWIPRFQGDPDPYANGGTPVGPYLSPHSQEFSDKALSAVAAELSAPEPSGGTITDPVPIPTLPGVGLSITYDYVLGAASVRSATNNTMVDHYVRLDQFGRPLPVMPNLPVSPDLLFSGDSGDNSLVQ